MKQARGEAASLLIGCCGCLAMFHGIGVQSPTLETVLTIGALIASVLLLAFNLRRPGRLILSLISIPLLALLSYGLVCALFWYFMAYLPSQGPLIQLGS